jgi:membrane protein
MFNRVWEVRLSRNYFQKLVIFWIILTTSPIILGGSLYFDQLTAQGTLLGTLKDRYWTFGLLYTFLVPALISFIAFTILNLVLPNTRVHLRAAVLGALVSAVLWEGAKKSFYLYVQETQKNARFYGSLGILPVFLFWIYVTWVIVLLGAEVTRAAQNLRQFVRLRRLRRGFPQPASPYLGVYLLDRIYSAFEAGAPLPSLEAVAEELDLVSEILEPVAKGLVENGILVPDGSRPGIFAPAKSSRSILLRDLVETLPENLLRLDELPVARAGGESGARVHRLFREARRAFLESFGSRTLGDLLEVSGGKAA